MGDFVEMEPCPECGSRDNVGVYTDGKYCFGCGWVQGIDKVKQYVNFRSNHVKTFDKSVSFLPHDASDDIHPLALDWLNKYNITERQIVNHKLMWSDLFSALIFPIHQDKVLRGWNGRIFGEKATKRKYESRGMLSNLDVFIPPEEGDYEKNSLILVEGFMDAIKVSNVAQAMPLFGTSLSPDKVLRLYTAHKISDLTLWLDHDKIEHMMYLKQRFDNMFDRVSIVVEKEDPKGLSTEYIGNKLLETLD